jgi:hypothetical protein
MCTVLLERENTTEAKAYDDARYATCRIHDATHMHSLTTPPIIGKPN